MDALTALKQVDFHWAVNTEMFWDDPVYDIPEINSDVKKEFLEDISIKGEVNKSVLGWIILGKGGSGKTHFLQSVRKELADNDWGFIMVDMSGVNDFWETTLLGFIDSLHRPSIYGMPQYQVILEDIIKSLIKKTENTEGRVLVKKIAELDKGDLIKYINLIIKALSKKFKSQTQKYHDTVRAIILLSSDDFTVSTLGYSWLQGLGIDKSDKKSFGFSTEKKESIRIVEALCWVMSLRKPFVLSFDQMDPVVMEHHLMSGTGAGEDWTDEQKRSKAIIEGVAGGLSALVQSVAGSNARIVVSCLEATWQILSKTVSTNADRFYSPKTLKTLGDEKYARRMVAMRLEQAYKKNGFDPAYPTFPFKQEVFEGGKRMFPREILRYCDNHRQKCIREQRISELDKFPPIKPIIIDPPIIGTKLDQLLAKLKSEALTGQLLDEQKEDAMLGGLLKTACQILLIENITPDCIAASTNVNVSGGKDYPYLHARMRLVYLEEGDREEHFCIRAILRKNARAFQARLKAAMTSSGIDKELKFRRLLIVHHSEPSAGPATQKLVSRFTTAGGKFVKPDEDELKTLWALDQMQKENHPDFDKWLRVRRPVSNLPMFSESVSWLFRQCCSVNKVSRQDESAGQQADNKNKVTEQSVGKAKKVAPKVNGGLPVGLRLIGDKTQGAASIPVPALRKHTVILAGAGSGKTVLVKRMVEEAALLGIPSIVLDCANDLSRMGRPWPDQPSVWTDQDCEKAGQYHNKSDVVVWTPGIMKGNPINFEPLPDLASVAKDSDELQQMIDMTLGTFRDIVAPGKSLKSKKKLGILAAALDYFAKHGDNGLDEFLSLLDDLPVEATGGIGDAEKLANEMADQIRAEIQVNVMLKQRGVGIDPAVLFGLDGAPGKTRISVVNFSGLPNLWSQQQFVNQLAMLLFTWIKNNPPRQNTPLTGLLVIDEAKDFVPSSGDVPSRNSLIRLANQARKYGLGLIFATQAPKSIDHNIIANCINQFYGQANSPAAIDAVMTQIKLRGGSGQDIPKMGTGKFYLSTEDIKVPLKIQTPLCLSYHPDNPPDQTEVIQLARQSRDLSNK